MRVFLPLFLAAVLFGADAPKPAEKAVAKPAATAAVRKPLAEQPLRMAKDIEAFEKQDKANPPPQHGLLLSGASSLRMWKNVAEEMKPYPTINRGFGGSYTTEVLGYMDRITLPYHPRVVVFHCGGNDINAGDPPEAPIQRIREYLARLRKANPDTAVVFMATTRAPSRKAKWVDLDQFNRSRTTCTPANSVTRRSPRCSVRPSMKLGRPPKRPSKGSNCRGDKGATCPLLFRCG